MTEDSAQIGKMSQNSNNVVPIMMNTATAQKRSGGMNGQQYDMLKNKGKEFTVSGVSKPPKGFRRPAKSYRQNSGRREQGFNKNVKSMQLTKESYIASEYEDSFEPQMLLNFRYSPLRNNHYRKSYSNSQYGVKSKRSPIYNKEAFLQANCNFIVDESFKEKYLINSIDPDVLVDWEHILLVYLPTNDAPECPICLYPPKAAKLTKCGHGFCWSCILHYLKLSDSTWRKCPICHEAVHQKDLKSVIFCERKKFARLDNITMKLMRRSKDSLTSFPADQWNENNGEMLIWKGDSFNSSSKLMLSSLITLTDSLLLKEKIILEAQLAEAKTDETGEEVFIQMALDELKERISGCGNKEQIVIEKNVDEVKVNEVSAKENRVESLLSMPQESDGQYAFTDEEEDDSESNKIDLAICSSDYTESEVYEQLDDLNELNLSKCDDSHENSRRREYSESASSEISGSSRQNISDQQQMDSYYFYQADDGQNIFIHSLNARCIVEEYGDLHRGPLELTGQIIDFDCFTMTKELRKRFRYLKHLPLSSEFIIVELMLRPPVLSRNTIKSFMPEFKKRKASRMKKLEEQRKFDKRASAARNRQEGYRVDASDEDEVELDLNNQAEFPSNLSPPQSQQNLNNSGTKDLGDDQQKEEVGTKISFAQIMKDETPVNLPKKQPYAWGVRSSPMEILRKQTPVFGTAQRRTSLQSLDSRIANGNQGNEDDDGEEVVAPSFKEMFSAAMLTTPLQTQETEPDKKSKGKKKKNNKGMLLFATGGQRKY